ncbi:hypothetical protein ACFFQF_22935 [Haladaptatus pallidirubidus]|uniref:Uncharacterized protein n=1 Tax=Haladaptatus pallidirubidus TaxID=1008152 RepID=A0AAV3UNZ7_9EURY|nr:hypothetical protein [Haladaptatus pallidirubidus]
MSAVDEPASWPDTPFAFEEFVDREERRQMRLAGELHESNDSEEERLSDEDMLMLTALHERGEPPVVTLARKWYCLGPSRPIFSFQ